MSQLARRYAQAAWDVAAKAGRTGTLVDTFGAFCAALAASPTLLQALTNPAFKDERAGVLNAVLETQAGAAEASPEAHRLLQLLLEHERIPLLEPVDGALRALADAAQGRMRAKVRLACAPQPAQRARIEEVLTQRMGKPVVVEVEVDPGMVAGMVCQVGRLTFDSSLRKQLGQFAERAGASQADL